VFIELQATYNILRQWKGDPTQPHRSYFGVSWLVNHSEPDEPLSEQEVDEMKALLWKHAPTSFASLFPDE
jgi:hypothetical protein